MKILALDIETSPAVVYTWGLWDQNVGLNQIIQQPRMLCFAAKWIGRKGITFRSEYHHSTEEMLATIHKLMDEADVLLHYNGARFDIPHLHREFLQANLPPPSPSADIDLLKVVRKNFRFISNKLQNVVTELDLDSKVEHSGFKLWRKCLEGDRSAWSTMRAYNRKDVDLLETLYDELLPWIHNHPNRRLFDRDAGCPKCGGPESELWVRGYRTTAVSRYVRLQCQLCKGWSHRTTREDGTKMRGT